MESKFVIFLLVATAAQSSLAMTAAKLCAPLTDLGAKLAVIRFAEDITRRGLTREVDIIFTEVRVRVAEKAGIISTNSEDAALRIAIAFNESLTAAGAGMKPLVESIRTFQPDTDVEGSTTLMVTEIEALIALYFHGIKLTEGTNYTEALAAIEKIEEQAVTYADSFFASVFDALVNGTAKVSNESKSVIECVLTESHSGMNAVSSGYFDGIKQLLQVNFSESAADINNYASAIEDAYKKTIAGFDVEISNKFGAIQTLVVAEALEEVGIVKGLLALRSVS